MKDCRTKKIVWKAALALLAVFILYCGAWLAWRSIRYGGFTDGMEKSVFSTFFVPRYDKVDEEHFDFGVKYPDPLSFVGNISIGMPSVEDEIFTDGLIIWPNVFKGYEFGVVLIDDGHQYCIYVDENGEPLNDEDEAVISKHKDNIDMLFSKFEKNFK